MSVTVMLPLVLKSSVVIRQFNSAYTSKVKVLSIVTGLWVDSQSIQRIKDVSDTNNASWETALHFLPEDKVSQLVNSVVKVLVPNSSLVSAVDLTHPEAVALMEEDTRGWARAVVTLAFTIARLVQEDPQLNWSYVEEQYQQAINDQYRQDSAKKLLGGLTYIDNLVCIALSPHPVRILQMVGGSNAVLGIN